MEGAVHPLCNWVPHKLIEKEEGIFFEWLYLGEKRFTEPFFDDTMARCRSHQYNSAGYKVLSTLENLITWSGQITSIRLSGLIFHVSRCGSTMISQLLTIPSSNVMISEAPLIDQVLRNKKLSSSSKAQVIFAVLKLLGQKRFPEESQLFIKLDAWHVLEIEVLRMYFPHIPFIILCRKPSEILKSHKHLRGMHLVPHALPLELFGLGEKEIEALSLDTFGAKVLEKYYQAIYDFCILDRNCRILDYQYGMENMLTAFNTFLKIQYKEAEWGQMQERLKLHSKYPNNVFMSDKEIELEQDLTEVNSIYQKMSLIHFYE